MASLPRQTSTSQATFRRDPIFPRIARSVTAILEHGKVVTPIDVLVGVGFLARDRLDDWRRGRVPYLESVFTNGSRDSRGSSASFGSMCMT